MNKTLPIVATLLLLLTGCSNANRSAMSAWGQVHLVKHFSGGVCIGTWETDGKVENESSSDGYYFKDKATGKMVTISGTVQITVE